MGMLDRKPLLMGNCFTRNNRARVGEVGNFLTEKIKIGERGWKGTEAGRGMLLNECLCECERKEYDTR